MNTRKCWQWGAVLLILALTLAGCAKKAPEQPSAGPAAGPGGGMAARPPGGPGGAGGPGGSGGPGGGGGGGMSAQWEEAQKKYPGTIALFRSVGGLRDLQEDGKEPLSSAQAKAVVPILKSLPSKEKLTQDEAQKVADQINGYLTPTQQEIIGARREARRSQWRQGGGGAGGPGRMGGSGGGGPGGPGKMSGPGGSAGMGGPGGSMGGAGRPGGGRGLNFADLKPDENPFRQERGKEMLERVIKTLEGKGK